MKPATICEFHNASSPEDRAICEALRVAIDNGLPDAKSMIWHGHSVWFLARNPIVVYGKLKDCICPMFWSRADFDEPDLKSGTYKFEDATVRYTIAKAIDLEDLKRWLKKGRNMKWDHKEICNRKELLERLV